MGSTSMDSLAVEIARFEALKKLAAERFPGISENEEKVFRQCASTVDFDTVPSENKPEVSAAFLRWLITDEDAVQYIDPLGYRIVNAAIASALALDFCRISRPLTFLFCTLNEEFTLRYAELPVLQLKGCTALKGISVDGARVQCSLNFGLLRSHGTVRFTGAKIGNDVDFSGARFYGSESIRADRVKVLGNLMFRKDFYSAGRVSVLGAEIGGDIDLSGASFAAEDYAFLADGARIGGKMVLRDKFSSSGAIRLVGADIRRDLNCEGAQIKMLMAEKMCLGGTLYWTAIRQPRNSYLDLLGASIGTVRDDIESWPPPGCLVIKGLEYKDLARHQSATEESLLALQLAEQRKLDAGESIRWLSLQKQKDSLDPQAWMWLANLHKGKDDIAAYRPIVREYRCRVARESKNPLRRFFGIRLAMLEENPWSILRVFFALLLAGTVLYWWAAETGKMPPTSEDAYAAWSTGKPFPIAYPRFNPLVYSLENELPLVKLGMDDKWAPDSNLIAHGQPTTYWSLAAFRWFLILAGWIQGILLTVGINRRFHD